MVVCILGLKCHTQQLLGPPHSFIKNSPLLADMVVKYFEESILECAPKQQGVRGYFLRIHAC